MAREEITPYCCLNMDDVKRNYRLWLEWKHMEKLLNRLELSAPLKLDINSGAGEGAVLAFTLFDAGIKAYNEMETFAEAGVHAEVEEFAHSVQVKGK